MKIYIIEKDFDKYKYLPIYFNDLDDVILVNDDFENFMKNNYIRCVVSPGNSFGIMDGGYDYALVNWYGIQLQERVQDYIIEHYGGEQFVGTSFIIEAGKDNQFLIHTPTMRIPSRIKDDEIVYQCMRSTLIEAKKNNVESILIPMFGGMAGGVNPNVVSKMMRMAYDQLNNPPKKIDWDYVDSVKL